VRETAAIRHQVWARHSGRQSDRAGPKARRIDRDRSESCCAREIAYTSDMPGANDASPTAEPGAAARKGRQGKATDREAGGPASKSQGWLATNCRFQLIRRHNGQRSGSGRGRGSGSGSGSGRGRGRGRGRGKGRGRGSGINRGRGSGSGAPAQDRSPLLRYTLRQSYAPCVLNRLLTLESAPKP
jgi:hypothetical protein